MSKVEVSFREFARIIDVNHSVVSRAIAAGRLQKSVVGEGDKRKVIVFDGCLEWHQNKNFAKDRSNSAQPLETSSFEMEVADSNRKQRHYDSLLAEVEYRKSVGMLTTTENFSQETRLVSRTLRDNFLYIPTESSHEIKRLVSELIRKKFDDQTLALLSSDVEAIALSFRIYQKSAINRVMQAMYDFKYAEAIRQEIPEEEKIPE